MLIMRGTVGLARANHVPGSDYVRAFADGETGAATPRCNYQTDGGEDRRKPARFRVCCG